jgi:hypothetical protein
VLAAVALAALVAPVAAQPSHVVRPAEELGFLTSFNYHLSLEAIGEDDPQFSWVGYLGGDFDFVGGPRGRANAAFEYEVVLGSELQPFDPNQGNYAIELLGAGRLGQVEVGVLFHHSSRHLGDRAKDFGIAWNLIGPQVLWTRESPGATFQVRARALKAWTIDFVDYSAEYSADALYRRRVGRLTSVVLRGDAVARTIDSGVSNRGTQSGWRADAALRIAGRAAALELFGGGERRIEASAFGARPMTWALVGLRILSPD